MRAGRRYPLEGAPVKFTEGLCSCEVSFLIECHPVVRDLVDERQSAFGVDFPDALTRVDKVHLAFGIHDDARSGMSAQVAYAGRDHDQQHNDSQSLKTSG